MVAGFRFGKGRAVEKEVAFMRCVLMSLSVAAMPAEQEVRRRVKLILTIAVLVVVLLVATVSEAIAQARGCQWNYWGQSPQGNHWYYYQCWDIDWGNWIPYWWSTWDGLITIAF